MTRGDEYRSRAAWAEASAAGAADAELESQFLALAAQWRDLGRQADEFDAEVVAFSQRVADAAGPDKP